MRMYECNTRHEKIGWTLYQHYGLFALKVLLISQSCGDNSYRLIPVNTVQSLPQRLVVCLTVRGTLSGCEWRRVLSYSDYTVQGRHSLERVTGG